MKKGSGLTILPNNSQEIINMLQLRSASYKAGNTGLRNEIIDICDSLLKMKIINKQQYKSLMLQL